MEDYLVYGIVIVAIYFMIKKLLNKNSGCGCGGSNNCSKK